MQILYTGDNEGPAVMTLEQLISNFNESGGWQFRHNESDMRHELESRGWYEGSHDNGHYLALNLNKLRLLPHPTLDDESRAKAPAAKREPSRFFAWFDGIKDEAKTTAAGQFMTERGFTVAHTGGGCLAWEKAKPETQWGIWISNEDSGLGLDLGAEFESKPEFGVMLQNTEGDFVNGPYGVTIAECLTWAESALVDPDAMLAQENCKHRDNGRGICCDCGKPL